MSFLHCKRRKSRPIIFKVLSGEPRFLERLLSEALRQSCPSSNIPNLIAIPYNETRLRERELHLSLIYLVLQKISHRVSNSVTVSQSEK